MRGSRSPARRALTVLAAALLLAGCASERAVRPKPAAGIAAPTRIVQVEGARSPQSAASAPLRGAQAAAVAGAASAAAAQAGALTYPVREAPALPGAAAPSAGAASAASGAAPAYVEPAPVAARFPDPDVEYRTPAFEPGRSAFTSNAELQTALRALAREPSASGGTAVRLLPLGSSQTGVPIEALLLSRLPDTDPEAVNRAGRVTVLLVGQQHGDEPAGSEALLVLAQELARGRLEPLLERLNVVVLPRANPDGARDGRRTTASGIDLNRDHLLLRTPEAQAIARLVRDWRPAVVVDAHEYAPAGRTLDKFGLLGRQDALLQYAMTANVDPFIARASEEWFRQPLVERLKAAGLASDWYHTTSADPADRRMSMGGVQPDNGRNVNGLRHAVSLLVETRGVGLGRQHLKRRVLTHVTAIASVLESAHERAADVLKVRQFAESETSARACQGAAVVEAAATPSEYALPMIDPQTGADRNVTVSWDSALELRPLRTRTRPCGYWLAATQTDAVTRLRGLGVAVQQLADDGDLRAETYRETARETGPRPDVRGTVADGGDVVRVKVATVPTLIDVKAGGYYVPLDQPLAGLAMAALEPDTPSSFVAHRIVDRIDALARVMGRPGVRMTALP